MKSLVKLVYYFFFFSLMFSCKKENPVAKNNKPPIAVAGPDQVITLPTDSVLLDGRASSDPDGTLSEWLWTKISGPASFNIIKPTDSITKLKTLVAGIYQFELKVTDNGGLSAKDTMRVIIDSVLVTNHPPIAKAGNDTTITLPANTIYLDGSRSTDSENNITSYAWTKISGPSSFIIINTNVVQTQATNLVQGTYQFELKVTDSGTLFSKDTLNIFVNAATSNLAPIANAGPDVSTNYDLQTCSMNPASITLNGSSSSDPDGTIVSYSWGSAAGVIANPHSAITQVSNLSAGAYWFHLTVTDNNGATNTDEVIVRVLSTNRPLVSAQLISIGTLSQTRRGIIAASSGNKIVFAGGMTNLPSNSSRADIFDIFTNTWATAELSQARGRIAASAIGNKIFFAGGTIYTTGGINPSSRVDIYDAAFNTWTTTELSQPREELAASSSGNKVVFAGGYNSVTGTFSSQVDIYDTSTHGWSLAALSESFRVGMSATTIGNKIYFAGGIGYWYPWDAPPTSRIDIYDAPSGSWSQSSMANAVGFHAAIAVNNKIYWAGGDELIYTTNSIEIKDASTQTSTFGCLFQPNSNFDAVLKNNKIVFFTGGGEAKNKFDIYDIATNTWSIGVLPIDISGASIISVNNTIYVAGGEVNGVLSNQVWKLEF